MSVIRTPYTYPKTDKVQDGELMPPVHFTSYNFFCLNSRIWRFLPSDIMPVLLPQEEGERMRFYLRFFRETEEVDLKDDFPSGTFEVMKMIVGETLTQFPNYALLLDTRLPEIVYRFEPSTYLFGALWQDQKVNIDRIDLMTYLPFISYPPGTLIEASITIPTNLALLRTYPPLAPFTTFYMQDLKELLDQMSEFIRTQIFGYSDSMIARWELERLDDEYSAWSYPPWSDYRLFPEDKAPRWDGVPVWIDLGNNLVVHHFAALELSSVPSVNTRFARTGLWLSGDNLADLQTALNRIETAQSAALGNVAVDYAALPEEDRERIQTEIGSLVSEIWPGSLARAVLTDEYSWPIRISWTLPEDVQSGAAVELIRTRYADLRRTPPLKEK